MEESVEIDPAEMAMGYVSNSDVLRFVQTIGGDLDLLFQVLWKHVLCLEFIRMRWHVETEKKSRNIFTRITERFARDDRKRRAIQYLRDWEGKFWITMDQNIKEITESYELKLKLEFGPELDRFKTGGQYDRRMSTEKKSELVARSRKIISGEHLQELHGVIDMLSNQATSDRTDHFILIDKLDECWVVP